MNELVVKLIELWKTYSKPNLYDIHVSDNTVPSFKVQKDELKCPSKNWWKFQHSLYISAVSQDTYVVIILFDFKFLLMLRKLFNKAAVKEHGFWSQMT